MMLTWWLTVPALTLTILAGCDRKPDTSGGPRSFEVGLIGTHGPQVKLRLEVPKGWTVRPDRYGPAVAAPGDGEFDPAVSTRAANCQERHVTGTAEFRPATAAECLEYEAQLGGLLRPERPPAQPIETTAKGPRIVQPGTDVDGAFLSFITLTPDQTVAVICVATAHGSDAVQAQARAVCESLVAENKTDEDRDEASSSP